MQSADEFDVIIVGAGISGLYMLYRMRRLGLSVRVIEAGGGLGGTWYWNRYPGARCDTDTLEYSYSFDEDLQQEWEWPERYPTQPEILKYLNHVADRFELRRDIVFDTRVEAAHYDEAGSRWRVATDDGAEMAARFLVMATGSISAPNIPAIDGMDSFRGPIHHTARWPHEGVDLSGKRVGIIGTGSSAVQAIPVIAEQAAQLTVFQRSPQWSVPAHNRPSDPEMVAEIKADYAGFRARNRLESGAQLSHIPANDFSALELSEEERERVLEERWELGGFPFFGAFNDITVNPDSNKATADFVRGKIRAIVKDPSLVEMLTPDYTIHCKRPVLDSGYFETYNRANVLLVDINAAPIQAITPDGIRTSDADYDLDLIVLATGFDAMTGALLRIDIRGRNGRPLSETWAAGPVNYLGLQVSGFPNLFTITGPGSPSVLTNMVVAIEQHVEWVTDCIAFMVENAHASIEATEEAQNAWVAHVNEVANATLWVSCQNWYQGYNIPGKPRVFMPLPGFPPYVEKCEEVAAKGYEGFTLS
ncbi:MAG: NAD(P)/FAD-dependent oxidoreductase [Chloroflexota bacterium]|nr:NAD(P)/FAD-dependent oxidoreductase [Chloroflexota bacterium]MDE2947779.1 NAD(P)/FAD-dependent oxidoreductase [Chloroflexota bacterium]